VVEVACVPVKDWHVEHVARNMREGDACECWALGGLTPRQALDHPLACDGPRWTGMLDGEPAAIFGVVPLTVMGGAGVAWLLGTPLLLKHWRIFARRSKPLLAELLDHYDKLVNVVHADNRVALRWLEWAGARFTYQGQRVFFELRQK